MEVSVESLDGLKRRITVLIQGDKLESKVNSKLKNLATRVQISGFRKGKAPLSLVKQRYWEDARIEAGQELLRDTFDEALEQKQLTPINTPQIDIFELDTDKGMRYSATFEVYPEFTLQPLDKTTSIEVIQSTVTEADVHTMIEKLREKNKTWQVVDAPAAIGHSLNLNFKGYVDGVPFEKGEAEGFEIELGSGRMIPGFEDALVGHRAGESFSIEVTFPEDYQEADLAGKPARFDIVLNDVKEGILPEIDAEFVKKFGVKDGDIKKFESDIRAHMERELDRRLREINHDACFSVYAKANVFDLPISLIDQEIENLKHEFYHLVGP